MDMDGQVAGRIKVGIRAARLAMGRHRGPVVCLHADKSLTIRYLIAHLRRRRG